MADGNMPVETLNRPEDIQIQTASLQEPTRLDAFENISQIEVAGTGAVCDLQAHRASELQRHAREEEARLKSLDFKLYQKGLSEIGVPEGDAKKQAKAVRKDYYGGDLNTRERIVSVLNGMMSAIAGVNKNPTPNEPQPVEVKIDR